MMAILVDGSDYYNAGIPEFNKEYSRALHLLEEGNLDDFNEDDNYEFTDEESCVEPEIVESFIESSEILELKPNDFWKGWNGEDYEDDELPTVKVKVTLKDERWAEKFDGTEWDSVFSIVSIPGFLR